MIIIATVETLDGNTFATTEVEAKDYAAGFAQLRSNAPEGQSIINVRVQR
ncbi:hypothetical protein SAMN04489740_4216 [Arthrobacter alpinus]|uniref:Uncharacterized protein n=1 Tax=Arthrobacter alpinus TaxID=656366 RepID=A0A1H5PGY0_9MICC|nr:hypothetical protein [Arthrobacter alpinus]SEF12287.1 hypothetical protein SAMN04489740_4216 [Arthrobacter alpinus]